MKLTLRENRVFEQEVDVQFPYYYKHEFDNSTIYGKVTENTVFTIDEYQQGYDDDHENKYEVEIDEDVVNTLSSYYKKEYQSNEKEFNDARTRFYKLAMKL